MQERALPERAAAGIRILRRLFGGRKGIKRKKKMSDITWKNERRKVVDLIPADYNPRTLSDKEREDLTASIKEFSEVEPVVINLNNHLVGGHQRVTIYADLGIEEIDVRVPNRMLTDEEERRLNLRLNKNTGSWDWKKLMDGFDTEMLDNVGFNSSEVMAMAGLEFAEEEIVDEERLEALQVFPPEQPKLKERAAIHFSTKEEYDKVKAAIDAGKITAEKILAMI
jgi:hypothetical protein